MDQIQNIKNGIMGQTQGKKLWVAPELEVLDGRKTYGGEDGYEAESDWWVDVSDRAAS